MRINGLIVPAMLAAMLVAPIALAQQAPPADPAITKRADAARQVAQDFLDQMRTRLKEALRENGPAGAIGACNALAPDVANARSVTSGFEIERTALKVRNPDNAPDPWETRILELFQARVAAGGDVSALEHFEVVVTSEGDRMFRYMRAIPTGEVCLACHGSELRQDVKVEIARYYPSDKATGFRLGELRGALSLAQIIAE